MAGQPTKYEPIYGPSLVEHMGKGFSYESYAGAIGVCLATLYNWEKVHPEFLEAKNRGFEQNRYFYEDMGIRALKGEPSNSAIWIFNMKNRFPKQWRDKQEVEATNTNVNINKDVTELSNDELDALVKRATSGEK